jgi:hypothetical protein
MKGLALATVGVAVAVALALVGATNALASSPVIATATVNADRSISVTWNLSSNTSGDVVTVSSSDATDSTGEMTWNPDTNLSYSDIPGAGQTSYTTKPLDMTITQPTTIYLQVWLVMPYWDGSNWYGCGQGSQGALVDSDCDSQVVALTVQPICTQTLVTAGHYVEKLVKRAHVIKRNGRRIRVKATYRKVWVPPVYSTSCH